MLISAAAQNSAGHDPRAMGCYLPEKSHPDTNAGHFRSPNDAAPPAPVLPRPMCTMTNNSVAPAPIVRDHHAAHCFAVGPGLSVDNTFRRGNHHMLQHRAAMALLRAGHSLGGVVMQRTRYGLTQLGLVLIHSQQIARFTRHDGFGHLFLQPIASRLTRQPAKSSATSNAGIAAASAKPGSVAKALTMCTGQGAPRAVPRRHLPSMAICWNEPSSPYVKLRKAFSHCLGSSRRNMRLTVSWEGMPFFNGSKRRSQAPLTSAHSTASKNSPPPRRWRTRQSPELRPTSGRCSARFSALAPRPNVPSTFPSRTSKTREFTLSLGRLVVRLFMTIRCGYPDFVVGRPNFKA